MKKVGRVVVSYEGASGAKVYANIGNLIQFPHHDTSKGGMPFCAIINSYVNLQELARLQGKDGVMLSFYLDEKTSSMPAELPRPAPADLEDDIPF